MEILKYQEVTFEPRFGNRDYDRPFRHIPVTLCRFTINVINLLLF